MQKNRIIPIIMLVSLMLATLSIPHETLARATLLDETFDSAIPAGWAQVQYSGDGIWQWRNDCCERCPPNTDGGYLTADSDANSSLVYDVGLFTSSIDMSNLFLVKIELDKNFQVYCGYGEASITTYSGGTGVANREEVLGFWDTDDPEAGEHVSYTIHPSTYADPSKVYVEFWYSTEGQTWVWSFSIDNLKIEAENEPPTAKFSYAPVTPCTNQSIAFDASLSSDPDGTIVLYEWDFDNDGTYDSTGQEVFHGFTLAGNYDITLQVTDNGGGTDTYKETLVIEPQANPIVAFTPIRNNHLAVVNSMWDGIKDMLPDDVPRSLEDLLSQVQIHINNSRSTANTIYANNELMKAIEQMKDVLSLL